MAAAPPDIDRFFQQFLEEWLRAEPESATALRIFPAAEQARLDGVSSDATDAAALARISRARDGLKRLAAFDRSRLTPAQRLSAEMLEWLLSDVVAEEPFLSYSTPLNQMTGLQARIATFLSDVQPVRSRRDAENYLARLAGVAKKIDQASARMKDRDKQGVRPPDFILEATIGQMRRFTSSAPEDNILTTSLATRLENVPEVDAVRRAKLTSAAGKLVAESVYPAYRRALDNLSTIKAKANADAGLWRLPRGAEAYAFYLRRYTTTSMTAEEIHNQGLAEVARIEKEMDALLRKLGYTDGDVRARYAKLQSDNTYPDSPDVRKRILADYEKILREAGERSAEAFDRRPGAACLVQRIPEYQEANAAANYQLPAGDGSRPGIFRVPLRGPRFTRVGMRTLAHHEGIPGHHFQLALQVEMKDLPAFRRSSVFGPMSAFSEGWALYAETLASELGWYRNDAVSDIGRLDSELFRARRLVVDTGLHAKRWTRQQVIDYGIPRSEAERYVVMPGQACSYKLGQLKILDLRARAKTKLGARFALKEFHNMVLGNGSIPLALLERVATEWMEKKA
jgi:uncharacterized protein (DUF885 family)